MTKRYKIHAELAGLFAICLMAGLSAKTARADVIYTYTGNPFDTFNGAFACPPVCNVHGSFTVAQPLAANLPTLTLVAPMSFSLTAGNTTLTDGEPADSSSR